MQQQQQHGVSSPVTSRQESCAVDVVLMVQSTGQQCSRWLHKGHEAVGQCMDGYGSAVTGPRRLLLSLW